MSTVFIQVAECGLRITLIAAATMACLAIIGRRRPAVRAAISTWGLVLILLVTGLAAVPLPGWWSWDAAAAWRSADVHAEPAAPAAPAAIAAESAGGGEMSDPPETAAGGVQLDVSAAARRLASVRPGSPAPQSVPWPLIVLAVLAGGAAAAMLRLGWSLATALRISRRSHPVPDRELHERLAEIARRLNCGTRISLRETTELHSAAAVGWSRPTVVLPIEWREWSGEELDGVLAHEVAHIARRDFLTRCLALLAGAVHFYHPLVRLLCRRVVLNQELSADELAATAAGGRTAYLQALSRLALREDDRSRSGTIAAVLPVFSGFLIRRITMLKAMEGDGRGASRRWPGWVVGGLLVMLAAGVAGVRGTAAPPASKDATGVENEAEPPAAEGGRLDPGAVFRRAPIDPSAVVLAGSSEEEMAQGAFVIRVSDLLKQPGFERKLRDSLAPALVDDLNGLDWYWKDMFESTEAPGIALRDIDYIVGNVQLTVTPIGDAPAGEVVATAGGNGSETQRVMFGSTLTHIRLRKRLDWKQLVRSLPQATQAQHAGVPYLRISVPVMGPVPLCVFPADERTIGLALDESVVRRVIDRRAAGAVKVAEPAWLPHWKAADGGLVTVLVPSPAAVPQMWIASISPPAAPGGQGPAPDPTETADYREYVATLRQSPAIAWSLDYAGGPDIAGLRIHLALSSDSDASRICTLIERVLASIKPIALGTDAEAADARLRQLFDSLSVDVADHLPQGARGITVTSAVRLPLGELLFGESGGATAAPEASERVTPPRTPANASGTFDEKLKPLQGEWSIVSMTHYGISVDEELLRQTRVSVSGDQLVMDQFWRPVWTRIIDPETREVDGSFRGDPGQRFTLKVVPGPASNAIDLIVSGVVPAEAEADLSPKELAAVRDGTVRQKGIYAVDGDQLTICWGEWSAEHGSTRPTDFTAGEGSNRVLVTLKRKLRAAAP